jgi:hypothetical protein
MFSSPPKTCKISQTCVKVKGVTFQTFLSVLSRLRTPSAGLEPATLSLEVRCSDPAELRRQYTEGVGLEPTYPFGRQFSRLLQYRYATLPFSDTYVTEAVGFEPTSPFGTTVFKTVAIAVLPRFLISRWRDSNPRPSGPKPDALPDCATSRIPAAGFEPATPWM